MGRCLAAFVVFLLVPHLHAQQDATASSPDAELRLAFDAWQAKWQTYLDANKQAREGGKLQKGALPPANVQAAEREASAACKAVLQQFGDRPDLSAASYLLLARLQETSRDYAGAVTFYARSLGRGDPDAPDLGTLHSICIAAMNSKDDAVAAQWMQKTIAAEDQSDRRRDLSVRTSYYPRTLIALGDWQRLEQLVRNLAKADSAECQTAAKTFGIVASIHRGEIDAARAAVAEIGRDPKTYPDQQGWAAMAQLALCVHDGAFDDGQKAVRDYLAVPEAERSARDRNYRRYLAAIEPFLGKPAPALRSDHCVGGDIRGEDVLPALRGKVVVLDFWQPWCEPCRKAMPEMVKAQRDFDGAVQVLGVCKVENYGYDVSEKQAVRPIEPKDYPAHVEDFRSDMGLTYPLLVCDTSANSSAYRIAGVPTLVIADRFGIVRYMSCGAGEPGLFRLALQGVIGKQ